MIKDRAPFKEWLIKNGTKFKDLNILIQGEEMEEAILEAMSALDRAEHPIEH